MGALVLGKQVDNFDELTADERAKYAVRVLVPLLYICTASWALLFLC